MKFLVSKKSSLSYIAKGGFWIFVGKGASMLASIAIMIAFANLLPKETYGAYRYILSFFSIASLATLPGINTAVVSSVARGFESTVFTAEKEKLRWGILGTLFLIVIGGYYTIQGNYPLGISFLIAGIFLPLRRVIELFPHIWQGRKNFQKQNIYEAIGYALPAIALIASIIYTQNLIVIIGVYFASYTIVRGIIYFYTKKTLKQSDTDTQAITFGKHLSVIQILLQLANQLDKVILWQISGPVAVATLSFAQMPIGQLKEFFPIEQLSLPKLSEQSRSLNKKTIMQYFWSILLFTLPIVVLLMALANLGYTLFFPAYLESVRFFQLLCLGLLFMPFVLLNTVLVSQSKTRELYIVRTVSPVVKILLYITLGPLLGIQGIVYSILIGQAIDASLVYYFFNKLAYDGTHVE